MLYMFQLPCREFILDSQRCT